MGESVFDGNGWTTFGFSGGEGDAGHAVLVIESWLCGGDLLAVVCEAVGSDGFRAAATAAERIPLMLEHGVLAGYRPDDPGAAIRGMVERLNGEIGVGSGSAWLSLVHLTPRHLVVAHAGAGHAAVFGNGRFADLIADDRRHPECAVHALGSGGPCLVDVVAQRRDYAFPFLVLATSASRKVLDDPYLRAVLAGCAHESEHVDDVRGRLVLSPHLGNAAGILVSLRTDAVL